MRGGPVTDQDGGLSDGLVAGGPVGAGQVGVPLRGRPPRELGLGGPAGVDLGQDRGGQGGDLGAELLELLDGLNELGGVPGRPQGLGQGADQVTGTRDHPGGGGRCLGGLLHDPNQPETTDSHRPLTCGYPPRWTMNKTIFEPMSGAPIRVIDWSQTTCGRPKNLRLVTNPQPRSGRQPGKQQPAGRTPPVAAKRGTNRQPATRNAAASQSGQSRTHPGQAKAPPALTAGGASLSPKGSVRGRRANLTR